MITEWKAGQEFYFASSRQYYKSGTYELTRTGRKYAYFGHPHNELRIEKATGVVDGGPRSIGTLGRAHGDIEAHLKQQRAVAVWQAMRQALNRYGQPPSGLTLEDMLEAALKLKVEVPA